jgi:hypothetical protein
MLTLEEKKIANKIARDKYRASPKYKAWLESYRSRPEVREANLQSVKRWQAKPGVKELLAPGKRKFNLKDKYGITPEVYDAMALAQNGVCAICGRPNVSNKRLSVDHDHKTGKVRELLCNDCNCSIGLLQEDPSIMIKMANYITKHSSK